MARTLYGGTGGELLAQLSSDGDYEPSAASFTAWTARTGGTQLTSLQTLAGGATTTVAPDANGRILFFGPDPYTGSIWLRNESLQSATRYLVNPVDLADRPAGGVTEHGALTGLGTDDHTQYQLESQRNAASGYMGLDASSKAAIANLPTGSTASTVSLGDHGHAGGGGGATDHGALTGLADDDHAQYQLRTQRNIASGYMGLDANSKALIANLPTGSTSTTVPLGDHTHAGGGGGGTDHGLLTGLTDDDHTQYHNDARGDVRYMLKAGSITQAADVADTAPFDGSTYVWETDTNLHVPTDLTNRFAAVDTDGRIAPATYPQWYVPMLVINEGDPVPTNFPPGGVVLSRPSAGSLVPVGAGNNFALQSTTCVVTTTEAFAVGDYIGFGIGASGEVTLPTTFTVAYGTGAGAKSAAGTAFTTGSIQADLHYARVTTAIPLGTAVTLTANQSRPFFMVSLVKMVSLAATTALDQSATAQGAASSALTLTVGPSGTTAQAQEWGLAVFGHNPGVGTVVRTLSGSGGWQAVGPTVEAENAGATSARSLSVFFRQLTATGAVTATAQVTSSDTTNAAWAGVLGTFKAA